MHKFRSSILLISLIVIGLAASLLTVLGLYFSGVLRTEAIELVYSVQSLKKVYDGTPLVADSYDLVSGELLKGHTASVSFLGEQTDVGTGECDLKVTVRDERGFDVTNEYAINVEKGVLIVEPAVIKISLLDEEVVYNGKKVIFNNYVVDEGRLVNGHRIEASLPNVGLVGVGDYLPEDLYPMIYDAAGKNVTSNYTPMFDFESAGQIRIIPRPITIAPVDARKTYDGTPLVADEYRLISGSLAEDQWAEVVVNGGLNRMTEAGVVETRITSVTIYAQGGGTPLDVTENYEINVSEVGTMQIDRRSLVLTTPSRTWQYDGEVHSTQEADGGGAELPEVIVGLASADKFQSIVYTGMIQDVGSVSNGVYDVYRNVEIYRPIDTQTESIDPYDVYTDGETGTAYYMRAVNNYDVTVVSGTLTVTPFIATVTMESYEKEYDGEAASVTFEGEDRFKIAPELPEGFTLGYTTGGLPAESDVGIYKHAIDGVKVQDADEADCSANFKLTIINGTVKINARAITVSTASQTVIYRAEIELKDTTPICSDLPDGHRVEMRSGETEPVLKKAGTLKNEYRCVIKDGDDTDVTKNYVITYEYGTFTVDKQETTIRLKSIPDKVYNGAVQSITIEEALSGNLPEGLTLDDFSVVLSEEMKNVKTYCYTVIAKATEAVANFEITFENQTNATCEIVKAGLKLAYNGDDILKTYDGKPVEFTTSVFLLEDSGGTGAKLASIEYDKITHGETTVSFRNATIVNDFGENVTSNYEIDYGSAVARVSFFARIITFSLRDFQYQGTEYPDRINSNQLSACAAPTSGLVEGDYVEEITVVYNAATKTISVTDCTVINSDGEDVSNLYNIDIPPVASVILVPPPTAETEPVE